MAVPTRPWGGGVLQWQMSPGGAPCSQTQHQASQAKQMQLGAGGADTNVSTRIRLVGKACLCSVFKGNSL